MIDSLFLLYVKTAVPVSLLIAGLAALTPLLRRRYAAKWRYWVWMVLALRLLIPFTPALPRQPVRIPLPERTGLVAGQPRTAPPPEPSYGVAVREAAGEKQARSPAPVCAAPAVWLAGAAAGLGLQSILYARYRRTLRNARAPGGATLRLWREAAAAMGVGRPPAILVSGGAAAPVLCGFFRPALYLPHDRYGREELELILRHELVHHRRRDLGYKLLLLWVACIHWWNPLAHILVNLAGKDIELSCDDEVTRHMDRKNRAAYGSAILAALPGTKGLPLFTTRFGGGKATLKGRLRNLFDSRTKRRGLPAMTAVALSAALLSGMIAYVPAAAAQPAAREEAVAVGRLGPDRPAFLGRFDMDGSTLLVELECETGEGIAVGVSREADLRFPMAEPWVKYVVNERGGRVTASFVDLEGPCYLYAVSETGVLEHITGRIRTSRTVAGPESGGGVEDRFRQFEAHGIAYDSRRDTALYGGQRVALFVIRREDGSFDLCWHDRSASEGSLCLEGIRDGTGGAGEIRPLEEAEAREMLQELYGASEPAGGSPGIVPVPYVMDGTLLLGTEGFTAADLTRETAPADIRGWMERCDAAGNGAHLRRQKTAGGYDTYVYYNLGGRFPWIIREEDGGLIIRLYGNSGKVTGEGYYLMHFESVRAHEEVSLLLDGTPLPFVSVQNDDDDGMRL